MAAIVEPSIRRYDRPRPRPFLRRGQRRATSQRYGTFLVKLVEADHQRQASGDTDRRSKSREKASGLDDIQERGVNDTEETRNEMPVKSSPRRSARSARSPRHRTARSKSPYEPNSHCTYDPRLDSHQQTYVLSPITLEALKKSMSAHHLFSNPNKNIGLHGPRRPLLLSYPTKPKKAGRAYFIHRPASGPSPRSASAEPPVEAPPMTEGNVPETDEARDYVRLVHHLRTGATRIDYPIPKKLQRPKTVAPSQTKAQLLAKEKGFVLDGVALSNIQHDYAKVQPKLGPAIPPYNSHFDKHVQSYFKFKGVNQNLRKTGQVRPKSESTQGKAVDRFHNIGDGHIYMTKRNRSGAGYSRDSIDGHDQFLSEIRPMNGYNGRFGFRRNTPILRNCASPFGTASRSPCH